MERIVDLEAKHLDAVHRFLEQASRFTEPALSVGSYAPVEASGDVLAYVRAAGDGERRFLVALNLGSEPHALDLIETGRGGEPVNDALGLRGDEGVVVEIGAAATARG